MSENEQNEWYPVPGYKIGHYSDGKYVPFWLYPQRDGKPAYAVIADPEEPEMAIERDTLDEVLALVVKHNAGTFCRKCDGTGKLHLNGHKRATPCYVCGGKGAREAELRYEG